MLTESEIRARTSKIKWWHPIDLGHGITPPALCPSAPDTLRRLRLGDLTGKTVLDVGAWDGFYSFSAEKLGASRVLATDSYVWQGKTWGSKAGFILAREALNSQVEDMEIDAMDLSPSAVGQFDVVLFLGVLYHLRHPLLGLEKMASCIAPGGIALIESHVDLDVDQHRPVCAFYPGDELNGDSSNWWGPNPLALLAMVRSTGLQVMWTSAGGRYIVCARKTDGCAPITPPTT